MRFRNTVHGQAVEFARFAIRHKGHRFLIASEMTRLAQRLVEINPSFLELATKVIEKQRVLLREYLQ